MPTLVSNFIGDRDIILHGENGILGYGEQVDGDRVDKNIFNAAGEYVSILPGASYFDSVEAFEMARGGRLHYRRPRRPTRSIRRAASPTTASPTSRRAASAARWT